MITINFQTSNLDDFKAAIELMEAKGYNVKPNVSQAPSVPNGERGEYEQAYLVKTGQKRFKMSASERERVDGGECTKEDIAKERIAFIDAGGVIPVLEELPKDDGAEVF